MKRNNTCIRLCFYISGLILFSFGISVTIYANIGVSSWDAVSVGLNKLYGCSIGTWMNLISICQIIAGGILCKERIRFETFLTSLGLGFLVDGFNLMLCHIPFTPVISSEVTYAIGMLLIAIGCGTYLCAGWLPTAIDYFMLSIRKRYSLNIANAMLLCECSGLLIALLCKGPIGYGTVAATFLYGPLIHLSNTNAKKLFKKLTLL